MVVPVSTPHDSPFRSVLRSCLSTVLVTRKSHASNKQAIWLVALVLVLIWPNVAFAQSISKSKRFKGAFLARFTDRTIPMVATVKLGDRELRLLVDLGVNGTVLLPKCNDLSSQGTVSASAAGGTIFGNRLGTHMLRFVRSEIEFKSRIGELDVGVPSVVDDQNLCGLLGGDFLANHAMYVSNSERFFAVLPANVHPTFLKRNAKLSTSSSGHVVLAMRVLNKEQLFRIDTGYSGGIGVPRAVFESLSKTSLATETSTIEVEGPGRTNNVRSLRVKSLRTLGLNFHDLEVIEGSRFVVGLGLLNQLDYVIDLPASRFNFSPKLPSKSH